MVAPECPRHRMVMLSSEMIWSAQHARLHSEPGDGHDPVAQVVTFGCHCCGAKSLTIYHNAKPKKIQPAEAGVTFTSPADETYYIKTTL